MAMSKERREEVAELRRKQILEASLRLFDEKGFKDTSIQDIADAAGISKGLIYRYFRSKEEVLEGHAGLIEECEKECMDMPTATEALRLYAKRLLGDVNVTGYQPPLRVYIMCYIQGHLSEEMQQRYFRSDHGKKFFSPIIKRGQVAGEFKPGDHEEMADIFWNYLLGCTATMVCNRPGLAQPPDFEQIINLFKIDNDNKESAGSSHL